MSEAISPQSLLADSRSAKAKDHQRAWYEARDSRGMIAVKLCSDARGIVVPDLTYLIKAISAGNTWQPYANLLASENVMGIVAMTHFDGEQFATTGFPTGCGGLGLKDQMRNGKYEGAIVDIARYAQDKILHQDLVKQAVDTASAAATVLDNMGGFARNKKVLAAVQDHLVGNIQPVGLFEEGGRVKTLEFPESFISDVSYNPAKLYENGIPVLNDSRIPYEFVDYLDKQTKLVTSLHDRYPDLSKMQKVQNPRVILMTTSVKPPPTRYPETFGMPGSVFLVSLAREEMKETWARVPGEVFSDGMEQVHYPISKSLDHFGEPDKPFSATDTLFIETHDLDHSKELANHLVDTKGWLRAWLSLPGKQFLVGAMRGSYVHQIERFPQEPSVFSMV